MVEAGLQAPDIPAPPPLQLSQILHNKHNKPLKPTQQGQQIVHLNWSHFKPKFSGMPEEHA